MKTTTEDPSHCYWRDPYGTLLLVCPHQALRQLIRRTYQPTWRDNIK